MKPTIKTIPSIFSIFILLLLSASSCYRDFETRFGFDSQFDRDSHGLTIMNVNSHADMVILEGEVNVSEGEVVVELINPVGLSVFSTRISSPEKLYISRSYGCVAGNWKLEYESINGKGTIHLHMNTAY
jgi:hypothetical protein